MNTNTHIEPSMKQIKITSHRIVDINSLVVDSDITVTKAKYISAVEYLFDPEQEIYFTSIIAVSNPIDKKSYIIPGFNNFYIFKKDEVLSCSMSSGGGFYIWKSLYSSSGSLEQVVDSFLSETSKKDLNTNFISSAEIHLAAAAPYLFFTANSAGGSQPVIYKIKSFEIEKNILKMNILSDGNIFSGDFWIDISNNQVVKSVIDGVEMKLHTGKMFASPRADN